METYYEGEVNPFGIDCMKCNVRNDLMDTFVNEDSIVLCENCLIDNRVTKMVNFSKKIFN